MFNSSLGSRGRVLAVLLVVIVPARLWAEGQIEWQTFTSQEGRFAAKFPGKVERSKGKATHFNAAIPGTDTSFRVLYNDLEMAPEKPIEHLKDVASSVAENYNAKPRNLMQLKVNGQPAIAFEIPYERDGAKLTVRCRYIQVDKRFYQMIVVHEPAAKLDAEVKTFFDSLNFLD